MVLVYDTDVEADLRFFVDEQATSDFPRFPEGKASVVAHREVDLRNLCGLDCPQRAERVAFDKTSDLS